MPVGAPSKQNRSVNRAGPMADEVRLPSSSERRVSRPLVAVSTQDRPLQPPLNRVCRARPPHGRIQRPNHSGDDPLGAQLSRELIMGDVALLCLSRKSGFFQKNAIPCKNCEQHHSGQPRKLRRAQWLRDRLRQSPIFAVSQKRRREDPSSPPVRGRRWPREARPDEGVSSVGRGQAAYAASRT